MANCFEIYIKRVDELGLALSKKTDKELGENIIARQDALAKQGVNTDSVNPKTGKTFGEEMVDEEIFNILKSKFDDIEFDSGQVFYNSLLDQDRLANELMKINPAKFNTRAKARIEAINSQLVDTNYTYNTVNVENLRTSEKQGTVGDFINRVREELGDDFNLDTKFHEEGFTDDFIDELVRMQKTENWQAARGAKLDTTTSNEAHTVARIFIETGIHRSNNRMVILGRQDARLFANKLQVELHSGKISEKFKTGDEFATFMEQHLDLERYYTTNNKNERVGKIDLRQALNDIYEQLLTRDGSFSWRDIDGYIRQLELGNNPMSKPTLHGLEYKNGVSLKAVNNAIGGDLNVANMVLNTISNNSEKVALTRFFGPNIEEGWRAFRKIHKETLDEVAKTKSIKTSAIMAEAESILSSVESRIYPAIREKSNVVPIIAAVRNVEGGAKLGSAVITASLDVPVFIQTGKRIFGNNLGSIFKAITGVIPFINNRKDQLKFSSYFLELTESFADSAKDRVGLFDNHLLRSQNSGGASRWLAKNSSAFSNFIFKVSGLNYWTRNLQAGAAGMYVKQFGELISGNKAWTELHPRFQAQLKKYRMTEGDWATMLTLHKDNIQSGGLLDLRGRLDMYKMGRLEGNLKSVAEINNNIRDKIVNAVSDAVNTMVIKPGQYDRLSTAGFTTEGTVSSEIVKTITQFKTQPITYYRKVIARQFFRNQLEMAGVPKSQITLMHKVMDFTALTAMLMSMSALQLQLKQYVAGKERYDTTTPEFWIAVAQQAGVVGIAQDFFMDTGGRQLLEQMVSNRKEPLQTTSERADRLFGPIFADIMKLIDGGTAVAQGGIRQLRGIDEGETTRKGISKLTGLFGGLTGFKNLLWTKMLWRKYMGEHLHSWWDSSAAQQTNNRLQADADRTRAGGQTNNWLYEKLP